MNTAIDQAVTLLKKGELVAIPTETVYGLAGDATNPDAIRKIFALKGRPDEHPVIVHIKGAAELNHWACDIPDVAYQLIAAFWPGPLTLILKKQPWVSPIITGGQNTIGIRAPNHPLTQALLAQFGGGLAAPSANRFGHVSPTTAEHVRHEFGTQTPFTLDGGATQIGVESTIIGLTQDKPTLLRPGGISKEAIEMLLKCDLIHHQKSVSAKLRVSGLLDAHYAPRTPLTIGTQAQLQALFNANHTTCFIHYNDLPFVLPEGHSAIRMPDTPIAYAKTLYAALRAADQAAVHYLFLEHPPQEAAWLAINDRLLRAAHQIL
jgi:L-threonylcarbamoyladenylate synthase